MEEVIVSVSPERIKAKGGNLRRNSTGKTITRSSLSSSNSEEKVLPHYLRASTSSCHDFCKYGRKHAFEAKEKHPITRTAVKNTETSLEGQNEIKTVNLGERKKKLVMQGKVASERKTDLFDKPKVTKKKVLSPVKKIEILAKPAVVSKPKLKPVVAKISSSPSNVSRVGLSARRNSETNASNASGGSISRSSEKKPLHTSGGLNGIRNSDSKKVKNMGLPKLLQKKELKSPITSLSPKPSAKGLASLKPLKYGNSKLASPVNNQDMFRRSEPKSDEIWEKTLYVIEPKPENSSLEPVRQESHSDQSSSKPSLSSPLLPSVPSSPSFSPHKGVVVEEEEEEEDEGQEEGEGEGEEEEEEESSESDSTLGEADDSDSEREGTENENHGVILKSGQRRLRSAMIHPEDKDCSPHKLKFRRGKVVNLQSENNGPRRLRFRKGRVVGETPNGKAEVGRRSFRSKRDLGAADSNGTSAEARTVVLKHQDVQGRKEEQGLLNEVIEVTASKLVETRKSKVKALVGAFETVISLQESKPATAG